MSPRTTRRPWRSGIRLSSLLSIALISIAGAQPPSDPLQALVTRMSAVVANLRGLDFLEPVRARFEDPRRLMAGPPELPPGVDPGQLMAAMQRFERIAEVLGIDLGDPSMPTGESEAPTGLLGAFYRDDTGDIVVLRGGESDLDETLAARILAHELTHALDDQHHDLSRFAPDIENGPLTDDRTLACRALVEGSAVHTELDHVTRTRTEGRLSTVLEDLDLPRFAGYVDEHGNPAPPSARGIDVGATMGLPPGLPALFGKLQVFPYAHGFEFVKALRSRPGGLEAAFAHPPRSTEQVIHPEKYLQEHPDEPTDVGFRDLTSTLAGTPARCVAELGLGEFLMSALLEEHEIPDAIEAAAGWDGDRLAVIQEGGRTGMVWLTAWDTDVDAQEFAQAAGVLMARRFEGGTVAVDGTTVLVIGGVSDAVRDAFTAAAIDDARTLRL